MTACDKNENRPVARSSSPDKSRVVHLTTVHHPYDPRIFHKQLKSLASAGFDSHLVAPNDSVETEDGVTIHPLPKTEGRWKRLLLQPSVWRRATELDADLYQIHDPELIPLAFLLRIQTDSTVVYDMHENYRAKGRVLGRALRWLEKWCFTWVDHVLLAEKSYRSILNGSDVLHTLIENYFKPHTSRTVKGDGPSAAPSGAPSHLLYTGTISEHRGLTTMIDLASEVKRLRRPEHVTLVGICRHPEQRKRVEARLDREELGRVVDRVGWNEYVPASKMQSYYCDADVGLALCEPHPNLTDSMPTKFYEYLHYGLPIICSDFPIWRDFVETNECGVVVPPGDAGAVVQVLQRWERHPEEYRQLARNARAAASKFRWERMGERLVEVYNNLLRT